ncbi:MAG: LptF/LptG family permease, partial [Planctomycetota bacterium]|nr:LptF/LptG family permease [Planctomycetota bacterium]
QELWIPRTAATVREVRGKKKGMEVLLHRKHLDLKSGIFIKINRYHVPERRAEGVTVLSLPMLASGRADSREYLVQAREMLWVEPELQKSPYWLLMDGQQQTWDEAGGLIPPPAPAGLTVRPLFLSFVERPLATNLTPEDLESQQQEVPLWLTDLRRKMRESLDRRWPVMYYSRFASPLSALILLLVGLPLITHYGSRNVFFGALVAAVVASAYFMLSSTFSNLALRGFLPAPLGPWMAPILFASLGITWTRYLRTG